MFLKYPKKIIQINKKNQIKIKMVNNNNKKKQMIIKKMINKTLLQIKIKTMNQTLIKKKNQILIISTKMKKKKTKIMLLKAKMEKLGKRKSIANMRAKINHKVKRN